MVVIEVPDSPQETHAATTTAETETSVPTATEAIPTATAGPPGAQEAMGAPTRTATEAGATEARPPPNPNGAPEAGLSPQAATEAGKETAQDPHLLRALEKCLAEIRSDPELAKHATALEARVRGVQGGSATPVANAPLTQGGAGGPPPTKASEATPAPDPAATIRQRQHEARNAEAKLVAKTSKLQKTEEFLSDAIFRVAALQKARKGLHRETVALADDIKAMRVTLRGLENELLHLETRSRVSSDEDRRKTRRPWRSRSPARALPTRGPRRRASVAFQLGLWGQRRPRGIESPQGPAPPGPHRTQSRWPSGTQARRTAKETSPQGKGRPRTLLRSRPLQPTSPQGRCRAPAQPQQARRRPCWTLLP
jgi:hypothetical protein